LSQDIDSVMVNTRRSVRGGSLTGSQLEQENINESPSSHEMGPRVNNVTSHHGQNDQQDNVALESDGSGQCNGSVTNEELKQMMTEFMSYIESRLKKVEGSVDGRANTKPKWKVQVLQGKISRHQARIDQKILKEISSILREERCQ
jgi:hypothetical protein